MQSARQVLDALTVAAGMASWAEVVSKGRNEDSETSYDRISDEEIAEAEELVRNDVLVINEESSPECFARWKYGLVGRFITGNQPLGVIKAAIQYYWGRHRRCEIMQANNNAWLFLFEKEADMEWAINSGPWAICGRILFLEHWTPNFDFNSKVQTLVPIWVLLPDLPKKLLSRSAIIALAARVGKPIMLDADSLATENQNCVRVKVRCDIAAPLLEGFRIEVNGFRIWQRFRYGGFSRPCANCGLIGHSNNTCPSTQANKERGRSVVGRRRRNGPRVASRSRNVEPEAMDRLVPRTAAGEGRDGRRSDTVRPDTETGGIDRERTGGDSEPEVELIVQLTGEGDAELLLQEGKAETGSCTDVPMHSDGGAEHSGKHTVVLDTPESDSEGEVRGTFEQASVGKKREGKTGSCTVRETRRSKLSIEDSSVADLFRNAGATEGVKVKASKTPKGAKLGPGI